MIVDRVQPQTDEDFDLFSFAGRVAFVGGTGVAVKKAYEEYQKTPIKKGRRELRTKSNSDLKEKLAKAYESSLGSRGIGEQLLTKDSGLRSFGSGLAKKKLQRKFFPTDINSQAFQQLKEEIRTVVGTEKYHFDREVPELLENFLRQKNTNIASFYTNYVDGAPSQLVFKMKEGNKYRINLRHKTGRVWGSANLSTPYVEGGLIVGLDGDDLHIQGRGAATLNQLLEDDSPENLSRLKKDLEKIRKHDPSGLSFEKQILNGYSTSEFEKIKTKAVLSSKLNPNNKIFSDIIIRRGYFGGTEEDKAGITAFLESEIGANPHNEYIGQAGSVNSHQTHGSNRLVEHNFESPRINRDVRLNSKGEIVGKIRSDTFKANIAYISPERRAILEETRKAKGLDPLIYRISEEGLIQDTGVKFKSIDFNRSMRISLDQVSNEGARLLDQIAQIKGIKGKDEAERIERLLQTIEENQQQGQTLTTLGDELSSKRIGELTDPAYIKAEKEKKKLLKRMDKASQDYQFFKKRLEAPGLSSYDQQKIKRNLSYIRAEQAQMKAVLDETVWGDKRLLSKELWKKRYRLERLKKNQIKSDEEWNKLKANNPLDEQGELSRELRRSDFIKQYNKEIKKQRALETKHFRRKHLASKSFLGKTQDGAEVFLDSKIRDLHLVDARLDSNTRELVFNLAEISDESSRAKVKTGGGKGKRYVEKIYDIKQAIREGGLDLDQAIAEYSKKTGIQLSNRIDFLSTTSLLPIKNNQVDWSKLEREANPILQSIAEKHHGNVDKALREVFAKHGMTSKGINTFGNQIKDPLEVLEDIGRVFGGKDISREKAIEKAVLSAYDEIAPGVFISNHIMGFQSSKLYAGAGKKSSMSARQTLTLSNLGLTSLLDEFQERRIGRKEAMRSFAALDEIQSALNESSVKGIDFAENKSALYSLLREPDTDSRLFQKLKNEGKVIGNNIIVDLGEDMGNKKVAIILDKFLSPHINQKYGTQQVSSINKQIEKMLNPKNSLAAREHAYNKYMQELEVINKNLQKKIHGGKIKKSMYGKTTPYTEAQMRFIENEKINPKKNLIFMHEADIKRQFGSEALHAVKKGEYYAWLTREPAEGISSSAGAQILSAEEAHKKYGYGQAHYNKGEVYVPDQNNSFYKAMFGDFDGDALSILGSDNTQLKNFVEMNPDTPEGRLGKIIRESQSEMADMATKLKGRPQANMLEIAYQDRLKIIKGKSELGKGFIGEVSEEVSKIHMGITAKISEKGLMNLSEAEAKHLIKLNQTAHLFVENILKAKHMSTEDIAKKTSVHVLDNLMGNLKNSKEERISVVKDFMDNLIYGEHIDYRDLDKKALTRMFIQKKGMSAREAIKEASAIFDLKNTMNLDKVIPDLIEMADIGQEMGTTTSNFNAMMQDLLRGESAVESRKALTKEKLIKEGEQIADWGKKSLGHFAKYAILPAATIGLVGSLTSTPKELQIKKQSIDGNQNRKSTGQSSYKANNGTVRQMVPGKHRQPSLAGTISGESQLLRDLEAKNAAVRLMDQRHAMDPYDLQEIIDQGF